MVIGVFLLIALATDSLSDESTNETVAITDCKEKPIATGKVHVEVRSDLPGHYGMLLITQQKVRHDTTCMFDVITNKTVTFNCDDTGLYIYDDDDTWTHDNSEDLWRVEVAMRAGSLSGIDLFDRQVQVRKYYQSNFYFTVNHKSGL